MLTDAQLPEPAARPPLIVSVLGILAFLVWAAFLSWAFVEFVSAGEPPCQGTPAEECW